MQNWSSGAQCIAQPGEVQKISTPNSSAKPQESFAVAKLLILSKYLFSFFILPIIHCDCENGQKEKRKETSVMQVHIEHADQRGNVKVKGTTGVIRTNPTQ